MIDSFHAEMMMEHRRIVHEAFTAPKLLPSIANNFDRAMAPRTQQHHHHRRTATSTGSITVSTHSTLARQGILPIHHQNLRSPSSTKDGAGINAAGTTMGNNINSRKRAHMLPEKTPMADRPNSASQRNKQRLNNNSNNLKYTTNATTNIHQKKNKILDALSNIADRSIAELVIHQIITPSSSNATVNESQDQVSFDGIAGLDEAKQIVNEGIVLPLLMPDIFSGMRVPWKGILLFGPPGTGKTLIAKAVSGFKGSTFFNTSASTLISKWRGDSEKIVRCLFEAARLCAPSVIFIDELDAIAGARGDDGEHEASRRLKTELLTQMDGIDSSTSQHDQSLVLFLATTNRPWDLDEAVRRRLEKRIYVPLPCLATRKAQFENNLKVMAKHCATKASTPATDVDADADAEKKSIGGALSTMADELAGMTDGYSGADIQIVCREAAMIPVRKALANQPPQKLLELHAAGAFALDDQPTIENFVEALSRVKPSVDAVQTAQYEEWKAKFGSD